MYSQRSIPTLGKLYIATTILLSLLVYTVSIDPYSLSYTFKQTVFQLAIWRPFTAILYLSRIGTLFPFHLLFAFVAFKYGAGKIYGQNNKADLLWMFILSAASLAIFSTFTGLYFYGNSFIMILLMAWAVQHPTDQFVFFKIYINSIYIPLIYAGLMAFLGSSYKNYMAGFLVGLFLGFIKNPSFIEKHRDIFPTPNMIKSYFEQSDRVVFQERAVYVSTSQQNEGGNRMQRGQFFSGAGFRIG